MDWRCRIILRYDTVGLMNQTPTFSIKMGLMNQAPTNMRLLCRYACNDKVGLMNQTPTFSIKVGL